MEYFQEVIRFLKKECPADRPIRVRRTSTPASTYGDCSQVDAYYLIRISDQVTHEMAVIAILIHEWAHALSWEASVHEAHGNQWGIAYSKVYRALLKHLMKG